MAAHDGHNPRRWQEKATSISLRAAVAAHACEAALMACQLRLGLHAEAAALADRIAADDPRHRLAAAIRGLLAAAHGDFAAAREEGRQIVADRAEFGHYHHAQYDLACIHALLGEPEPAIDQLTAAAANGYPCGPFFATDPLLASLHGSTPSSKRARSEARLGLERAQLRMMNRCFLRALASPSR